ncbi:MAG: FxDxF family PEP-CTERM protein [Pseudomonadota bacterium]
MMNTKLKAVAAAAIATLGLVGQAHALTASGAGTSGSLFLYVFEDRQANSAATNSAIFDLGLVSAFDLNSNFSLDLGANSAWTSFVSTMTPANVHWGVFGAIGTGNVGTQIFTTAASTPNMYGNGVSSATSNSNFEINSVYNSITACGASCGFNVVTTNDLATGKWDDTAGALTGIPKLTAGFDQDINFYKWTSTGTKSTNLATRTNFAVGGDADYWTLGSTGALTYTVAAVPEADTYAMLLAGLGLVGFMARRRAAV